MPETLSLRPALAADSGRLLAWRNAPDVRGASLNTKIIDSAAHETWYDAALRDPDIAIFIGVSAGVEIGMVRLNYSNTTARISILLDNKFRGKNLSGQLLRAALRAAHAQIGTFAAEVRSDNASSLALFRSVGFDETETGPTHQFELLRKDMK